MHQDNLSAKLLETNGRGSSSRRTRHINIRYFFVADVHRRKHITLEYCPTDEMIGDFFTKPLGGAKFRRFRNIIMNLDHDEHGPVVMDELMEIHHAKMMKRLNALGEYVGEEDTSESTLITKKNKVITKKNKVGSQECVVDPVKRSNSTWAMVRAAHKNKRGRAHTRTYAEVVAE